MPDLKRARKKRDKAYAELGQRLERAGKMRRVLDRMAVEKAVMTVRACVRRGVWGGGLWVGVRLVVVRGGWLSLSGFI